MSSNPHQKALFLTWLILGVAQAVSLAGCGSATAEDSLLSSGPSGTEASPASEEGGPPIMPVRVPRSFFQGELSGTVVFTDPSGGVLAQGESDASWSETPYEPSPAESGQQTQGAAVLADFHDTRGCLSLSELPDPGMCFQVMGDVSSIGVNPREMEPVGFSEWLASKDLPAGTADCGQAWNLSFSHATRESDGFSVTYAATRCGSAPYGLQVRVRSL